VILKNCISLSYCIIIGLIGTNTDCYGQKIALNDVAKIEFIKKEGGWFMSGYRRVVVVPEKNGWMSYQNRIYKGPDFKDINRDTRDSSTVFIRNVPTRIINQLLTIISQQKTGINFNLFNIETNGLIKYIDSTKAHLKPRQKADFVKAIQSKAIVKEAFIKALNPFDMPDKTGYWINITTKANKAFTIDAHAIMEMYNLPWNINGIKSYDPNIALIFEYVGGNNDYKQYEQNRLYKQIDHDIFYRTALGTRFNWDDFKLEHPASYALLKSTLTPAYFAGDDEWAAVLFKSSLLPSYLQIDSRFKKEDTSAINRYKRYEDTLVNVFKRNNFLFDYLKARPGCIVYLEPNRIQRDGKGFFKQIKPYYPAIDSMDYKQALVLDVRETNGLQSKWVVLPNNTLVLGLLTGTAKDSNQINFMNIPITVQTTWFNKTFSKSVCIVFDSSGKIIVNPDNGSMGMY